MLDGDQAELDVARPERGDLTDLRAILNGSFQLTETGEEPPSACSRDPDQRVATPDVLVVADAAGGTAEFWVYHHPGETRYECWEAFRDAIGVAAPPELVDFMLERLGP